MIASVFAAALISFGVTETLGRDSVTATCMIRFVPFYQATATAWLLPIWRWAASAASG